MPARPTLGLLVNPIAGLGGSVGLKGSDGDATIRLALERGAVPHAGERAAAALTALRSAWPRDRPEPRLLAVDGLMGGDAVLLAGFPREPWTSAPARSTGPARSGAGTPTTAEDTRRVVAQLARMPVDLLLVAAGDGTLRDVLDALTASATATLPVIGVPAGVKMHSAVFATSPRAAGELAAAFLAAPPDRRRTVARDVVDLDEAAYRAGVVAPRLYGELAAPAGGRRLQARKEPAPAGDAEAVAAIAADLRTAIVPGRRYVLGPGSTIAGIASWLGLASTLVGVDVIVAADGAPAVLALDVGEGELLAAIHGHDVALVVTPIGGQGFVLGRGNQQLSPAVITTILDRAGREGLVVVATPAKLAALAGRPLLVDTGDPALDARLAGFVRVVTGHGESAVYRVAAA